MFLISVIQCVIVITVTLNELVQSNEEVNRQTIVNSSLISSLTTSGVSVISEKNVTTYKLSRANDSRREDKSQNKREFPPSARHKRNFDTAYHVNDYDYDGIVPASEPELPECILSRSEFYLSWWVYENGTLRMPSSNRPGNTVGFVDLSILILSEDAMFRHVSELSTNNTNDVITFMSIANNELSQLPSEILDLVKLSLQYLSLANNNFYDIFADHDDTFQTWSDFPLMNSLKELDLRNCSLSKLEHDIFINFPNLERLFLSHNMLNEISEKTFANLTRLQHLDLSYNKFEPVTGYRSDPFTVFLSGMLLEEAVFSNLHNLIFLDLSHTKLKQESVRALTLLRDKVEQLSLCYTEIPLITPKMFAATNLKVLDLSGNPSLIPNLAASWFSGLEQKLEILIFQGSNIKNFSPLRNLKNLRMLDLTNNNINQIHVSNFYNFPDLEILDMSTNHISNWYERTFENNSKIKIINMRSNNINLMTPEMMLDFGPVKFLAIGANNFVCDCSLREFIDRATLNAKMYQCGSRRSKRSFDYQEFQYDPKYHYEVFLRKFHDYIINVEEIYKKIIGEVEINLFQSRQADSVMPVDCDNSQDQNVNSIMNFNFLLLDYSENDYHCVESDGLSKRKVSFNEIRPCSYNAIESSSDTSFTNDDDENGTGDGSKKVRPPNALLIIYISVGIPLTFIIGLWIWKRKDIRYFCAIFKNTLILSFDKDDQKALVMKNRSKKNSNNDDYRFDLFVSYSEKDRNFVLDHLIPNLEKRSEITICLHERDFQVGLSILENIIQCMDQSRCLLLVISESFLKSNWCSFEMHLAQHRLIETRREQLILVLLQDIPKAKRPRTLSFLMRTKTWIMWPIEDREELRNVFWKRLKKAIILNNWEPERSVARPRHSIV